MSKALELKLHSPAGSDPDVYEWPLTCGRGASKNSGAVELVETIRWVRQEFPEIVLESNILSSYDTNSYESMKSLVDEYNNAIDAFLQRAAHTTRPDERFSTTQRRTSRNLLRHILQQVYVHAVTNPSKLNQYEPFSPEVYGETSYELVCQIIDQLNITEEDTFLDLGSGVGQIVLQVAASTCCKMVWGIERSDWPNLFAMKMDLHFKRLMRWWGKPFGEYQLINGDFLDQRHSDKINSASVIFVNNLAFGPNLDHQLKERFAELRDGVRIISSKEFCPINSRLSERNLSNIGTIMQVSKLSPQGSVSWTGKSVSYYVHTIDRTKLKVYLEPLKETENTSIASTGHNNKNADRILEPSDLVDASPPVIESGVKSSERIRTRRSLNAEKGNPVKIGAISNCYPAGKPVGRVGKREDPGIKKKNSIRELKLVSSQSTNSSKGKKPSLKQQQRSCDISSVDDSIKNRTTQTTAVNDTTETPPSLQEYLDTIRSQMMAAVAMLKDENYRRSLMNDIEFERKRKNEMSLQAAELDAERKGSDGNRK
ncbi:histone-lysine N-methyltransferase, H3 lysine-79 specific-like isoform X2 [Daphnia pulex]|uniref:histone-lysine N-methyltransferase, H3 lysine-79 specific-like isoform X2 n=1 Tax=Daphnia pulex TaxID=6669 RepID=UPI001EDEE3C8|nr:histone-lysine N-methyltransferase, H3 lysine-79 specific-like isoform X2 [Daphnia pulex]